eukprot:NODE_946_length_2957_cov_0.391882.p1 type:complete len:438 gc:universal NODE_946_length_2957_cov_0.391882:980-2293(+)
MNSKGMTHVHVFIDGTTNDRSKLKNNNKIKRTNIYKSFNDFIYGRKVVITPKHLKNGYGSPQAIKIKNQTENSDSDQHYAIYISGVGTFTSSFKLMKTLCRKHQAMSGRSIEKYCYSLMQVLTQTKDGDEFIFKKDSKIHFYGFSRGAYQCTLMARYLLKCNLFTNENESLNSQNTFLDPKKVFYAKIKEIIETDKEHDFASVRFDVAVATEDDYPQIEQWKSRMNLFLFDTVAKCINLTSRIGTYGKGVLNMPFFIVTCFNWAPLHTTLGEREYIHIDLLDIPVFHKVAICEYRASFHHCCVMAKNQEVLKPRGLNDTVETFIGSHSDVGNVSDRSIIVLHRMADHMDDFIKNILRQSDCSEAEPCEECFKALSCPPVDSLTMEFKIIYHLNGKFMRSLETCNSHEYLKHHSVQSYFKTKSLMFPDNYIDRAHYFE